MGLMRIARGFGITAFFAAFVMVAAGHAQMPGEDDFTQWEAMVSRVDRVLEFEDSSNATLERLRQQVVEYRDTFGAAQNSDADQVERVQRQLEALGPGPAEGEAEPEDVALRREALNAQIAELRAPALRASEAFAEADAVVSEIDAELRARQAARALERYPLPVNPLNWEGPLEQLRGITVTVPSEIFARLSDPDQRDRIFANLPSAGLSLIAGALLVFRSRHWARYIAARMQAIRRPLMRKTMHLVTALAQLALPWAGLSLLLAALQLTGILGSTGESVLLAVGAFGFALIGGTWLVGQVLPRNAPEDTPLLLDPAFVVRARRMAYIMAACLSLYQGLLVLGQRLDLDPQTAAYTGFVLSVLTGAANYRLAGLFRKSARQRRAARPESAERAFSETVIGVLANLSMLAIVAALLAGLSGYVVLTRLIVYPLAGSFFLFALVSLLQRGFADFYGAVNRPRGAREAGGVMDAPDEGLVPTLIGVLLVIVSLPFLALIWGAQVTDLTELWAQIQSGFSVGDVRLSPTEFAVFLMVFAIGFVLTRLVQGVLANTILPKTRLDIGGRTAIRSGVGYVGIFLAAIVAITSVGIDMSSFAIFASALAIGIGFGLQTIVSNFVSGIILLIERPVAEGDWIEVGGIMGHVRSISVRATKIETFDRTSVIVPNADLVSGVVTNWTRGSSIGRVIVPVGVAYGTDTRRVERILGEIANAHPLVVIDPPPSILFTAFGADALDFEIRAIIRDVNFKLAVTSDLLHEIAGRFVEEDIEIPFAQRDVWLRNPETLAKSAPAEPGVASVPQPDEVPSQGQADDGDGDAQ